MKLESENKRLSAILSISDDLANGRDEVIVSSGLHIIKLESEIKDLREALQEINNAVNSMADLDSIVFQVNEVVKKSCEKLNV